VERTDYGWIVEHAGVGGPCDRAGEPYLFQGLKHDSINYPADLGGYTERLRGQAHDRNMPDAEIEWHLDVLAGWIETVEKAAPTGLWSGYKYALASRGLRRPRTAPKLLQGLAGRRDTRRSAGCRTGRGGAGGAGGKKS
jgi:hypothetical protein